MHNSSSTFIYRRHNILFSIIIHNSLNKTIHKYITFVESKLILLDTYTLHMFDIRINHLASIAARIALIYCAQVVYNKPCARKQMKKSAATKKEGTTRSIRASKTSRDLRITYPNAQQITLPIFSQNLTAMTIEVEQHNNKKFRAQMTYIISAFLCDFVPAIYARLVLSYSFFYCRPNLSMYIPLSLNIS